MRLLLDTHIVLWLASFTIVTADENIHRYNVNWIW